MKLNYYSAIIKVVTNNIAETGAHIRSILLGVVTFISVPIPKKIITNHIPIFENKKYCGKINSVLIKTIKVIKININILTRATTLIIGGYFPGNLPPIDAEPQGKPAAKQS
ncbi:MAG: hypothetical protein ACLFPQ_00570 [Candidatus Woesearchaeota archaeon]